MTREEHLSWCKERATEYLKEQEALNALMSFVSDMGKHKETKDHAALAMTMALLMLGYLSTVPEIEKWINGFN